MLQALTIWAAVIIVVISTLADLALVLIRASGRRGGRLVAPRGELRLVRGRQQPSGDSRLLP